MKIIYAILCAALCTASLPAKADNFRLSINNHGHSRGWGQPYPHWRHRGPYHHMNGFYGAYYARPIVVHDTTYIVRNYPAAATPVIASSSPVQGYCREYSGPVRIGGRIEQSYGTACLMPDGSWQIMD